MIRIRKSPTADTRTCDFANVSKEVLLKSSMQHIGDVASAFQFIAEKMRDSVLLHDHDKLSGIDGFHSDFISGFENTTWWDNHRKVNRHHLLQEDGIRDDVNLIDVLDFISDCVMAGMARSGSVYALELPNELLQKSFQNTVKLLISQVVVVEDE